MYCKLSVNLLQELMHDFLSFSSSQKIDAQAIEEFYGLTSDISKNSESGYILFYQSREWQEKHFDVFERESENIHKLLCLMNTTIHSISFYCMKQPIIDICAKRTQHSISQNTHLFNITALLREHFPSNWPSVSHLHIVGTLWRIKELNNYSLHIKWPGQFVALHYKAWNISHKCVWIDYFIEYNSLSIVCTC